MESVLFSRALGVSNIDAGDTYNISIITSEGFDIVCPPYSINIGVTITCPGDDTPEPTLPTTPGTADNAIMYDLNVIYFVLISLNAFYFFTVN